MSNKKGLKQIIIARVVGDPWRTHITTYHFMYPGTDPRAQTDYRGVEPALCTAEGCGDRVHRGTIGDGTLTWLRTLPSTSKCESGKVSRRFSHS